MRLILGVFRRSGNDAGPVSRRRGAVPSEGDAAGEWGPVTGGAG
jgi:hypothetical protein